MRQLLSRTPAWEGTLAEQRDGNIHNRDGITEQAFVSVRTSRDATLDMSDRLGRVRR